MKSMGQHIVIISSRLDVPGGTEKAICNLANLLVNKGKKVSILVLEPSGNPYFPLHSSVSLIQHDLHFGITETGNKLSRKLQLLQQIRQLRKIIRSLQPDVVLATEYHYAIAARIAFKGKLFSWEHHHFDELEKNRFWKFLFHRYYPRLDSVICLNTDEASLFQKMGASTSVIPNFIKQHEERRTASKQILTVARLSHVKGIDRLMQVAREILKRYPNWSWRVMGDGDEEEKLRQFIKKEGLENRLILEKPSGPDLSLVYQHAAIYCMTSRNECFPMVLLEAMSYSLPCIAFDCETGPRHIIENNSNGFLIKDGDLNAMVERLDYLIRKEDQRSEMGRRALENVKKFSPDRIYQFWEKLL